MWSTLCARPCRSIRQVLYLQKVNLSGLRLSSWEISSWCVGCFGSCQTSAHIGTLGSPRACPSTSICGMESLMEIKVSSTKHLSMSWHLCSKEEIPLVLHMVKIQPWFLVHLFLYVSLAVVNRNKGPETSCVKPAPLLMLASELQESFDYFDYTLSNYLSMKDKLHYPDGKAFSLGVILVHSLLLNICNYMCIFSVPFGGICSGSRMVSQHEQATRMQCIKKISGCWHITKFKLIIHCFSSKWGWIGANQIMKPKILASQALENSDMFVTLQGCGKRVTKVTNVSFNWRAFLNQAFKVQPWSMSVCCFSNTQETF